MLALECALSTRAAGHHLLKRWSDPSDHSDSLLYALVVLNGDFYPYSRSTRSCGSAGPAFKFGNLAIKYSLLQFQLLRDSGDTPPLYTG